MINGIILFCCLVFLIILVILIKKYGKNQKEKGCEEGISFGLGKPCQAITRLMSGEEYHFIFVFKVRPEKIMFLARNIKDKEDVFYGEITGKTKMIVNREENRYPRSGISYRVRLPESGNKILLETTGFTR